MQKSLRWALGLYFVVISLEYVPAALLMFGVQNTAGPNWILPAVPFFQGLVIAAAGVFLLRSASRSADVTGTIVVPPVESILQLFGVYFIVEGLVAFARTLSGLLFFNEVWSISLGSSLAAAGAYALLGGIPLSRPGTIARLIGPYSTA